MNIRLLKASNKCFLLNTEKKGTDPSCRFQENAKTAELWHTLWLGDVIF